MSLVDPRPNLYNQEKLIVERSTREVYSFRPGISGLAQINISKSQLLAETDAKMINELNTLRYFKYIFLTVLGEVFGCRKKNRNDFFTNFYPFFQLITSRIFLLVPLKFGLVISWQNR